MHVKYQEVQSVLKPIYNCTLSRLLRGLTLYSTAHRIFSPTLHYSHHLFEDYLSYSSLSWNILISMTFLRNISVGWNSHTKRVKSQTSRIRLRWFSQGETEDGHSTIAAIFVQLHSKKMTVRYFKTSPLNRYFSVTKYREYLNLSEPNTTQ